MQLVSRQSKRRLLILYFYNCLLPIVASTIVCGITQSPLTTRGPPSSNRADAFGKWKVLIEKKIVENYKSQIETSSFSQKLIRLNLMLFWGIKKSSLST